MKVGFSWFYGLLSRKTRLSGTTRLLHGIVGFLRTVGFFRVHENGCLETPDFPSANVGFFESSYSDYPSGQNKNYVLFQTLYTVVHAQFVRFDKVTIKYFVAGHRFMAADAFHAAFERSIERNSVLLNIGEFEVWL